MILVSIPERADRRRGDPASLPSVSLCRAIVDTFSCFAMELNQAARFTRYKSSTETRSTAIAMMKRYLAPWNDARRSVPMPIARYSAWAPSQS